MCLAIPGKIIKIEGSTATVEYNKELQREANCSLIKCSVGDYVIVQAGFIIEIVSERRAKDMYKIVTGAVTTQASFGSRSSPTDVGRELGDKTKKVKS